MWLGPFLPKTNVCVYSNNFWLLIDKTMQVSYAVIFLLTLIISFFMEVLGLPESIWKLRYHLKSGGNMILIWYWCAAKVGKEISLLRCFFEILKKITRFAAWTRWSQSGAESMSKSFKLSELSELSKLSKSSKLSDLSELSELSELSKLSKLSKLSELSELSKLSKLCKLFKLSKIP